MKDLQFYQELADDIITAYPVDYELEIRDAAATDLDQGSFYVEGWEGADEGEVVPEDKMVVELSRFEGIDLEEAIDLLRLHVFMHEMAHVLQFRSEAFEEEREGHHDPEWGLKSSLVYEFIMERGIPMSAEEGFEKLGLTKDAQETIITKLADAITRDMENETHESH